MDVFLTCIFLKQSHRLCLVTKSSWPNEKVNILTAYCRSPLKGHTYLNKPAGTKRLTLQDFNVLETCVFLSEP